MALLNSNGVGITKQRSEVHATHTRGMVIDASGVSHLERVRKSHVCALYDGPQEQFQSTCHDCSHLSDYPRYIFAHSYARICQIK